MDSLVVSDRVRHCRADVQPPPQVAKRDTLPVIWGTRMQSGIGTFPMPLDRVPESSQGGCPSSRILQHPPVADPFQNGNLRSGPLGDPAMPGLTTRVLVLSGEYDETWPSRRSGSLLPPVRQHRFGYGAVDGQDASTHGVIKGLGQRFRHLRRHAHRLVEFGSILDPLSLIHI